MKLSDLSTGPKWIAWIAFLVITIISIVLISGRGSWMISGYNTASKEEKAKYDENKLCRITGTGLLIISLLIFIMLLFEKMLPANFIYLSIIIILSDCAAIIIAGNTICKKK